MVSKVGKISKDIPWQPLIDPLTGLERDDWWYLYCKERGHIIGNAKQTIIFPGKYYNIQEARDLSISFGMNYETLAKRYALDEDVIKSHYNRYEYLLKDHTPKEALRIWRNEAIYEFYKKGWTSKQLMEFYGMAKSSIYRAIKFGKKEDKK